MALDFPNAPTVGQKFPVTPQAGVPTYTWDGEKWTTAAGAIGGKTPIYTDGSNAMAAQLTLIAPPVNPAHAAAKSYVDSQAVMFNNIVVNGGMEIDQANAGAAVAVTAQNFSVDCWSTALSGTSVISVQQVADAPPGFSNSLKLTVTTGEASLAAADRCNMWTLIEGYRTSMLQFGTAGALPVSIGFWTKTHRPGTYSGSLRNTAGNRSYPFSFTQAAADTWQYNTVTIPGDVTGTWPGNVSTGSFVLGFTLGCGTTYQAPPNAWIVGNFVGATGQINGIAANTDTFQITGVSMVAGTIAPTAAQSPLLKRSYSQELLLCMRNYEKGTQRLLYIGANGTASAYDTMTFMALKRATPSITMIGWGYYTGGVPTAFTPAINGVYVDRFDWTGSGLTGWQGWSVSGAWIADARLS